MRRFFSNMNPTLRGLLVVALVAALIVVLNLERTLTALFILARIAFLLAIAFFVYLVWREQRQDISMWPRRARWVFYGAALLIVADIGVWFARGASGPDLLAVFLVIGIGAVSMWRVWRDAHTYSS